MFELGGLKNQNEVPDPENTFLTTPTSQVSFKKQNLQIASQCQPLFSKSIIRKLNAEVEDVDFMYTQQKELTNHIKAYADRNNIQFKVILQEKAREMQGENH
jgi:hypothetical protein